MMRVKIYLYGVALLASSMSFLSYGMTIGSDSSVDYFPNNIVLNDGDRVATFALVAGGIQLAGEGTTGIWSSTFPITGLIGLNHGTLNLEKDFILHNVSELYSLGTIIGNHHVFQLAPSIKSFPSAADNECSIIPVNACIAQPDDVETLDWSPDGKFVAIGLGEDSSNHDWVRVYEFDGTTATFKSANGNELDGLGILGNDGREITSVRFNPTSHILAVGRLITVSAGSDNGDELLTYSVNPATGALGSIVSSVELGVDVYALAWHPSGEYLAVGRNDLLGEVAIFSVSAGGIINPIPFAVANIIPSRIVQTQALSWDPTGTYLSVGLNDSSDDNLLVYEFDPGALFINRLLLNASTLVTRDGSNDEDVRAVDWNQVHGQFIAVGLGGTSGNLLKVYQHNGGAGTLTEQVSAAQPGLGAFVRALHWSPNGNCLALGRDPGTGPELRVYEFDSTAVTLSLVPGLTGGSFESVGSYEAVRWSPNGSYLAAGSDSHQLCFFEQGAASAGCVIFDNLKVVLTCNVTLKDCCIKFTGDSVLNGQGHCLTLSPTCTLLIDSDANLLMKDIIIKGVNDHKIQNVDYSSTVSLKDVEWVLDNNYSFTHGRFDVLKDFKVVGDGYVFAYESDQVSTIEPCGTMILDHGVTFRYDPLVASQNLLQLAADTSQLKLLGATLQTSAVGMQLTKGQLIFDRHCFIDNEGANDSQAVILGDGADANNNVSVQWLPGAQVEVIQGLLVHNDA